MPRKKPPLHLRRPPGRPQKYPWDRWFDGQDHIIRQGDQMDFTCSLSTMQQQIYSRAHEMGVKVSARRVHNDGLLVRADRSVARTASNAKYDWPKLLDGEVHTLILGRDITSKSASFKVYARQVAHDKGFGLQIRTMGNQLLLKAIPRDQEPKKGQPAIPLEPPVDRLSNPLPFDLPFKVTQ